MNCAISTKAHSQKVSCITKKDLLRIAKKLTNVKGINIDHFTKKQLKKVITKITGKKETEWYKIKELSKTLRDRLYKFTFKTATKNNVNGYWWLSNVDIDHIMGQFIKKRHYKNKYNFVYYGTFSSDELENNQSKINEIKELLGKGKKIGIIYNTDTLRESGSHWVAVYLTKHKSTYFDPNGSPPNKHISHFLKEIGNEVTVNNVQYQKFDGTCGMWSIGYLMKMISHKKLTKTNDKTINGLRTKFFVKSK